jgi:hypothetical protein
MLKVKVNIEYHKLFCIKYMFVSGVYSLYLYGSINLFYIHQSVCVVSVFRFFYGVLVVFKYPI